MSEFEKYIFDTDLVAASLPIPQELDIEIISDLKNEGNLEEIALAETALFRQTHPNLYLVSENVAAYQRITHSNMVADRSLRVGFGIGAMTAYEAGGISSSTYYLQDVDRDVTKNFNESQWWQLAMLLGAVEKGTEETLEPLYQAMDYHLEFRGDEKVHHSSAKLGASVCYAVLGYQWEKLDGELEDLYREHSTIAPEIASLRSRQILSGLSAALQHYPRSKKLNPAQTF